MTAGQYERIEALLAQAEEVVIEQPPLTAQGKKIQTELHSLLQETATAKARAELRERSAGDRNTSD